mgnify:CR=1 FL=1
MKGETMIWEEITLLTVAYCSKCHDEEGVKAYMDITSEWMKGSPSFGWKQTITCKRCKREVEQESKVSRMFDMLGAFD